MAKGTTKKKAKAPTTSTRPRGRPVDLTPNAERGDSRPPKKKPMRPRARPGSVDVTPEAERGDSRAPKKKMAGGAMKTKKYAKGGMARGCGAATKGGKYSRSG